MFNILLKLMGTEIILFSVCTFLLIASDEPALEYVRKNIVLLGKIIAFLSVMGVITLILLMWWA